MIDTFFEERKSFTDSLVNKLIPLVNPGKAKLNVHTFGYRRFHHDGKSFGFSDNSDWNQIFCEQFSGIQLPEYERDLSKFIDSDRAYLLRTGIPDKNSHFLQALYENNIWNTLSFPIKNQAANCLEVFFLSTDRSNTNVIEEYVNELKFIRQWISSIHTELQTYFDDSFNKASKSNPFFATTITNEVCLKKFSTFLKPVSLSLKESSDHLKFSYDDLRSLSAREREIFLLLTQKYKRRQIAMQLNVSPKTIDSYIARIKNKTNTFSKPSLLREFEEYSRAP